MLLTVILFVLWCGYVTLEGWREGLYWKHRILSWVLDKEENYPEFTQKESLNTHGLWTLQRFLVLLPILFLILNNWWLIISFILVFPFFHDGMYYQTRKETYNKGWFDQSNTSTSWMTKIQTPFLRTLYFGLGILLIVLTWILK